MKFNPLLTLAKPPLFEYKIREYPVYVKDTESMGKGVFAKRNIKKGEICCWYDGIIIPRNKLAISEMVTGIDGYNQIINKKISIAGFKTYFKERKGGVAQMCNDYSMEYLEDYAKNINIAKMINGECNMTYIANRDILKDEQLFVSYGEKYWEIFKKNENLSIKDRVYLNINFLKEKKINTDMLEKLLDTYVNNGDELGDYLYRHNFAINFNIEFLKTSGNIDKNYSLEADLFSNLGSETKEELKTETKEKTNEELKTETKEETNEELKIETKEETKEETNEELKTETKEETNEELKTETKEETNEELKTETKE